MGLNIKSDRVHALAREAARRTGRNQTSAIELALERLLSDLDRDNADAARIDLIHAMQRDAAGVDLDTEDLYDADGLPR